MSSPHPHPQPESGGDELDRLIRRTLEALVAQQVPPEHVWKRIKEKLNKDKSPPRGFKTTWISLVVQPALTLLLVVLGVVGLQELSDQRASQAPSSPSPPPPLATVYLDEELTSLLSEKILKLEGGD